MNNSIAYLLEMVKAYEDRTQTLYVLLLFSDGSCILDVDGGNNTTVHHTRTVADMIAWLELHTGTKKG